MSAPTKRGAGPAAISLIEESIQLLRQASVESWMIYYTATVPFMLGLLFFWAQVTWFAPAPATIAWWALGLAGLFTAMKAGQSEFCARLMAQRLGEPARPLTAAHGVRLAVAQLPLQAWGLLVVPLAAVLGLPFGWVYAYFQNATVLGDTNDVRSVATGQALLWPGSNHLGLLLLAALSIAATINLAAAFWLVPWLANRLLGIENVFGFTGVWFGNSTFLASVAALVWFAMDPLVKAFYTLRVFHGRSRTTGEDLRVDLTLARAARKAARASVAALVILASILLTPPSARAAVVNAEPAPIVGAAELDRAIDQVLAQSEFRWRLRPPPAVESASEQDGPIKHFIREGLNQLSELTRTVFRALRKAWDWIGDLFPSHGSESTTSKIPGVAPELVRVLLYLFLGAVAVLIIGLIAVVVWRNRRETRALVLARPALVVAPDLRDEATQAAQLPTDGWLALAREQLAKGEGRLALRALQLATLARLAAEGLIALGKAKTNLDYERELRRRAVMRQELVTAFAQRRGMFEAVWYGASHPVETEIRSWLSELEQTPQR